MKKESKFMKQQNKQKNHFLFKSKEKKYNTA